MGGLYFKVVLFLVFSLFCFGGLFPFLFSAASTELVIIGWVGLISYFPLAFFLVKYIIISSLKSSIAGKGKGLFDEAKKLMNEYKEK